MTPSGKQTRVIYGLRSPSSKLGPTPHYTLKMGLELLRVVKVRVIGVDISKDKLTSERSTRELPNNEKGFEELLKLANENTTIVLESTGVYSIRLTNFILSRDVKVRVLNPLDYEGV